MQCGVQDICQGLGWWVQKGKDQGLIHSTKKVVIAAGVLMICTCDSEYVLKITYRHACMHLRGRSESTYIQRERCVCVSVHTHTRVSTYTHIHKYTDSVGAESLILIIVQTYIRGTTCIEKPAGRRRTRCRFRRWKCDFKLLEANVPFSQHHRGN